MLVLARRRNETVVIEEITIEVLEIRRGVARLGITAPPDVEVMRGELLLTDGEGKTPMKHVA